MSSISYKSPKNGNSFEIHSIHWPGLLDIILTVVLIFILILTVFFISRLKILPWLSMLKNQKVVSTKLITHYQNYPRFYNYHNQRVDNGMEISQTGNIQTIKISGSLLFRLGAIELVQEGLMIVDEIGKILSDHDEWFEFLEIVGHTDRLPVRPNPVFKDNLDLSCLRAASVVRYLIEHNLFSPSKLSAVGRSYFERIDVPDLIDPEQRRVEIRISYKIKNEMDTIW